jgi:hypothetical protein
MVWYERTRQQDFVYKRAEGWGGLRFWPELSLALHISTSHHSAVKDDI